MYKKWLRGKTTATDGCKLFNNIYEYGWECFRIELLEEIEVKNKKEISEKVGNYIRQYDTFKNGLNSKIPSRSQIEYQKSDIGKKKRKVWISKNKEKISKSISKYQKNNRDKINKKRNEKYICIVF